MSEANGSERALVPAYATAPCEVFGSGATEGLEDERSETRPEEASRVGERRPREPRAKRALQWMSERGSPAAE
ncbi:MAG: hypothetical protein V5A30_01635 [Haloarculaceae archaeon]